MVSEDHQEPLEVPSVLLLFESYCSIREENASDSAGKNDCRVSVRQKDKVAFVIQLLPTVTHPKGLCWSHGKGEDFEGRRKVLPSLKTLVMETSSNKGKPSRCLYFRGNQ